ncbi:MAG: hypothetical protein AB1505_18160 [Candidatus Latescibacterota bacterium]
MAHRRRPSPGIPAGLRFCLLFLAWLAAIAVAFHLAEPVLARVSMYPVSRAAAWLLGGLGVPAALDAGGLEAGFCDLRIDGSVYRIIHECTGIFALLVLCALVLGFPTSAARKVQGIAMAVPAFAVYSTLRLVCLGLVAQVAPAWVDLVHRYLMVLVNLGFLLSLWLYWLTRQTPGDT